MTWATETAKDRHRPGFYVKLAGVETMLGTHDFVDYGVSGTFLPCIAQDSLSGGESSLDHANGILITSGFSFACADSQELRSLLRRRGGTEDTLAGGITPSALALFVSSGGATYPNGTTVYIDQETIVLNSHTGGGLYSISTRGAHDSEARRHTEGVVISDVPRHWLGRECELHMVHLETGDDQVIRYGRLSASPRASAGEWSFEAADRFGDLLNRPLLSGFGEETVESIEAEHATDYVTAVGYSMPCLKIYVPEARRFATGDSHGHIRLSLDGGSADFILRDGEIDTASNFLRVAVPGRVGGDFPGNRPRDYVDAAAKAKVRQVEILDDVVGRVFVQCMVSDLGDGTAHLHDVLGGVDNGAGTSDELDPPRRVGAGISSSRIDVDQMISASDDRIRLVLDGPSKVGDLFTSEMWRTGGFGFLDDQGRVSWKKYEPSAIRSAVASVDDSDLVGEVESVDDEENTISRAEIRCNYDSASGEFTRKLELVWADNATIYGDKAAAIAFECKSLWVGSVPAIDAEKPWTAYHATVTDHALVEAKFDRWRYRANEATRRFRLPLRFTRWADTAEGSRLSVTSTRILDHRGSLGVSGLVVEVVGRQIDYQTGDLMVEVEEVPTGVLLAPSCAVSSWDLPSLTVTIDTAGSAYGTGALFDDASPGLDFPVGCYVRIFNETINYSASDRKQVTARTATTLTLDSAPSFSPAARDIITVDASGDSGNANDVEADVEDFAFGADSNLLVGAGTGYERNGPIWG